MKKTSKLVAIFAAASLTVGGIAMAPASNAAKLKACVALDTGGVDDKGFNASAWAGAQSVSNLATAEYLSSTSDADYAPNIKKFVDKKCDIIIGVGFLINNAIVAAAKANPTIKFAIVDQDGMDHGADGSVYPGTAIKNLKPLQFASNETSFVAGYLAAGYSKTGKVATYGGMNIPTVTIFMAGFAKGVNYYNSKNGTKVQTLGWDLAKNDGTFVGNFSDQTKALQISKNFEQQGADVIFPVAGGLEAATAQNSVASKKSVVIGVDTDGALVYPQYKSVFLASTLKGVGESVAQVIKDVSKGKFSNSSYIGTIANKGESLSPLHDFDKKVSAKLTLAVKIVTNDIRAGRLKA